jgi:Protein of unknown function (DUF1573)
MSQAASMGHGGSDRPTRPGWSQLRRPLLFISIPLALLALAVLTPWVIALVRLPVSGERRHDFGTVQVGDEGIALHHRFSLRNKRDHDLTIRSAKSTCGCIKVNLPSTTIAPGQELAVETTMSFTTAPRTAKPRTESIVLDLGPDGLVTLTLTNTAVRAGQIP